MPALEQAGAEFRCTVLPRSDGIAASAVGADAGLVLDDPTTWPDAVAGVRRVVLADLFLDVGLRHALVEFLSWSADHGVRHVLCCSVAGASPGMVQHRIEEQLLGAGLPCTVLRPTPYFQLLETDYWSGIVTDDRLAMPWGVGRIAWVDARDVAEVVTRMVATGPAPDPGVVTLTGPQPLGGADIAADAHPGAGQAGGVRADVDHGLPTVPAGPGRRVRSPSTPRWCRTSSSGSACPAGRTRRSPASWGGCRPASPTTCVIAGTGGHP